MDLGQDARGPGDLILDRYMPNASAEEREKARENLRAYATVVLRIATRLALEEHETAIRAKTVSAVPLESNSPHI